MNERTVSTTLHVSGVRTDEDVKSALQALYDVFAELGLGQATFEVTDTEVADLFIKHDNSVTVDVAALNTALTHAGDFHIVS